MASAPLENSDCAQRCFRTSLHNEPRKHTFEHALGSAKRRVESPWEIFANFMAAAGMQNCEFTQSFRAIQGANQQSNHSSHVPQMCLTMSRIRSMQIHNTIQNSLIFRQLYPIEISCKRISHEEW
jgi:hypothetical protein